jgi:hypothetical protein
MDEARERGLQVVGRGRVNPNTIAVSCPHHPRADNRSTDWFIGVLLLASTVIFPLCQ